MYDVIFLGDSLTFGYGVKKEDCWVSLLTNKLCLSYLNKGINGDTTASMISRYYNDSIKYNPQKIFLMIGTNDILSYRNLNDTLDNILFIIKDILSYPDIKLIIGIPPHIYGENNSKFVRSSLHELHKSLISICNKYNITYIDFYNMTKKNYQNYLDGIHLNTSGNYDMYIEALKHFV